MRIYKSKRQYFLNTQKLLSHELAHSFLLSQKNHKIYSKIFLLSNIGTLRSIVNVQLQQSSPKFLRLPKCVFYP